MTLAPSVLDLDVGQLEQQVMAAVNAALAPAGPPSLDAQALDPDILERVLASTELQARRTADEITGGLDEAIRRIGPRTGMAGDPTSHGLADLFTAAREQVDTLRGATVRGDGVTVDGGVRAVAVVQGPGGGTARLTALEIEPAVVDTGPAHAGEQLRTAVNAALAAAHRNLPPVTTSTRPDVPGVPGVPGVRARVLPELGVRQLRGYLTALGAITASIEAPDGDAGAPA